MYHVEEVNLAEAILEEETIDLITTEGLSIPFVIIQDILLIVVIRNTVFLLPIIILPRRIHF